MDSPKQANAAQLAARSIKAKPKGRLNNQKAGFAPVQNNNPNNNAGVGGGGGGGLFGGSISAPGSFNFAAPSGTPTFTPSFGNSTSNQFAAPTNEDPRADTTGEEALRKEKVFSGGFRSGGGNEEALFASHSPYHQNQQQSNTLDASNNTQAPSLFGAANATQPNGGGLQFGTSTSQNQTESSIFGGFNYTPSQATNNSSNSTFAFGSSSQTPTNNSTPAFNFGATNSGQAESSLGFGANSTSKTQNPFTNENKKDDANTSFGQNNTNNSFVAQNNSFGGSFGGSFANQANTSFTGLNSTNAAAQNSQSLFGNMTAATSAPPSSNVFTSSFLATTSAPSTTNMFGSAASSFPTASAPSTTNLFSNANSSFPPATASTTPLFGAAKPAESTTSAVTAPLFGSLSKPADSTSSAPSTSLFGGFKPTESNPSAASTSFFGGLKPVDPAPSAPGKPIFGGSKPTDPTPASSGTSNIFAKPASAPTPVSTFTGFNKPAESTADLFNRNNQSNGQNNNLFGSKSAEEPKDKQTLNLFNKPVGQQHSEQNAMDNTMEKTPAKTPNALFAGFGKANSSAEYQLGGATKEQSFAAPSDGQAASSFKIRGSADASGQNNASSIFKPVDASADAAHQPPNTALGSFPSQAQGMQASDESPGNASVCNSLALNAPTNASSQVPPPDNKPLAPGRLSDFEFQVSEPTDLEMERNMPPSFDTVQRNEFKALWRIASVQRAMAAYFHHLPPGADPSKGLAWMEAKKKEILAEHKIDYISNKRGRPQAGLENDENQENMSPQKRIRQDKERPHRVPSPEKRPRSTRSPDKRSRATNEPESDLNGNSMLRAPKLLPGRSSSRSRSPSRSAASEPTSNKKRKNETQLESGDGESGGHKKRKPEQPSRNEVAESGSSKKRKPEVYLTQNDPEGIEDGKNSNKRILNGSSSSTSNMFKNILDSPERKTRALPGAAKEAVSVPAEAPTANPFGNLAGASPIKSNTGTTSTTPSKPPAFKFTPTSTTPTTSPTKPPIFASTSGVKPPAFSGTPVGGIKPPTFPSTPTDGIKPPTFSGAPNGGIKPPTFAGAPTGGVKPPTFGSGPVNFMAQFGQKAAESAEDNEKLLMQKAKDADFDSEDDDEAEWEANYKKKRAAELKELEELAKNKAPNFLVKSTGTTKSVEAKETAKPTATNVFAPFANTTSTPLFGQAKSTTGAAESIFSSANASGTSTPSLFSGTGSVLGGAAKTSSFAGNPFAHLSDADSNNQNDGDDESSDDGSDGGSEKKDPSYKPNTSDGTLSTPSAHVDESASSIASKKAVTEPPKLKKIGSTASSGATTPTPGAGGSLLSRMTRDPVSDENEKSAPKPSTNMFGSSFGATSDTPADKTWKPDTPIKFGSTPPSAPAAPTFNFTASTPTKPVNSPFGGLFGNSGASTPVLSNGPATTTGFQFGGPPSATSSLFPSVAASANTSRATSPGATTEGATDADDNDPEKVHAQVNLLESNPGEENEDVIHSVRTRALKFTPREEGDEKSPWDTKGVGPLKVLRHKETKATRILLRSDPSGSIILNKSLLSQVKYEASGKTIKLMTVGDDGKGLQSWVLQVKGNELAEELAKCLEDNKVNNS
ncbi:1d16b447-72db-40df-b97c-74ba5e83f50f [Sclerotinia trifoliorum]|uniref:1d16b447-72db-40df-b97c-74ba5e83f50f n=1 Tax=Sclerotinia trifoliorum TaxID=28548 RepID=A0A8H2ZQ43_9HELO|nr:1d16b447-72db-40df-b97c-74ba5e83f50f [Sclerotinia trifoliorum]